MLTWSRRGIAALAIACQLAGCSFVFVKRAPPHVPPGAWVECTETTAWPIGDALYGTAMVVGAVGVSASDDAGPEELRQVVTPVYALIGAGLLYSSYVRFRETSRCTRIREDAAARGVLGPPPHAYPPASYPYPAPRPQPPSRP